MLFTNPAYQRPINTYSKWVYVGLVILMTLTVLYALPNLYGEDWALQVSGSKGEAISQQLYREIEDNLKTQKIDVKGSSNDSLALYRFFDSESQLRAKDVTDAFLAKKEGKYSIALNQAPNTPDWLKAIGAHPLKLGLDLRGGVHFLMEVDMNAAIDKREQQIETDLKTAFREGKAHYASVVQSKGTGIVAKFRDEKSREQAESIIAKSQEFSKLLLKPREQGEFFELAMTLKEETIKEIKDYAVKQNIATLRNRINALGVAEPLIQRHGADRILVQLPGVQDSGEAKRILGTTATLQFRLVNETAGRNPTRAPIGSELVKMRDGGTIALRKSVIVDGTHLTDASVGYDESSNPQINVNLDAEGGSKMLATTSKNVNKPMAIVLIESKPKFEVIDGEQKLVGTYEEKEVVSAPNIGSALSSKFRITGRFSPAEAHELALILRSGSLIAPIYIVEERSVGPSLGKQNIELGKRSILVGFVAVLLFMLVYYRLFGLVANIALMSNLVFIVAIMSLVPGAVLTLPGIAGIVLTVGMAVDANVLIYERIREEMREGVNPAQAIHNGYDKAFSTIADANITTLIAALVLFAIGSGPVAGFAVTLFIGILTSMFTAIYGSRAIINLIYGGKALDKISI